MAAARVWAVDRRRRVGVSASAGPKQFADLGGARLVDHAVGDRVGRRATRWCSCVPDADDWDGRRGRRRGRRRRDALGVGARRARRGARGRRDRRGARRRAAARAAPTLFDAVIGAVRDGADGAVPGARRSPTRSSASTTCGSPRPSTATASSRCRRRRRSAAGVLRAAHAPAPTPPTTPRWSRRRRHRRRRARRSAQPQDHRPRRPHASPPPCSRCAMTRDPASGLGLRRPPVRRRRRAPLVLGGVTIDGARPRRPLRRRRGRATRWPTRCSVPPACPTSARCSRRPTTRYRDASSLELLREVVRAGRATRAGRSSTSTSSSRPRSRALAPHLDAMVANLVRACSAARTCR